MNSDLIIVGGGIAGLYAAYQHIKQNPRLKITILERNRQLGGRIDTFHGKHYTVEAGAGRFHNNQVLVMKLIHELGLDDKLVPISGFDHYMTNGKLYSTKPIQKIIKRIIQASKREPDVDAVLKNTVFLDYAKTVITKDEAALLYDSFGYSSELTDMNAFDAIVLMEEHFNPKNQYYVLAGGLYQIVEKIVDKLKANGRVKMLTRHRVNDIEYVDGQGHIGTARKFKLTCDNLKRPYYANKCICALPKETLLKLRIFSPIYPMLNLIRTLPLCRIYGQFPVHDHDDDGPWFKDLPKITTNNHLRIVIPMDESTGTMMISYTDNKFARYWKNIMDVDGVDEIARLHQKLLQKTTHMQIPVPEHIEMFYWEHGVAYFAPGFDSSVMPYQIMKPYIDVPLYVCGENYSAKNSQWIEGALEGNYLQP